MRTIQFLPFFLLAVFIPASAQERAIDHAQATRYFHEIESISALEHGALWGKRLYGPILFVEPGTHEVVANQPDAEGKLKADGNIWRGVLPKETPVANTAVDWGGVKWTMVMWPLPKARQARAQLLAHECFHRLQSELKLPQADSVSPHLDTAEGRAWMRLEWRALLRALETEGSERRSAVADAMLFRGQRLRAAGAGSDAAARAENALLMNEGLAEYTGIRAASVSRGEALVLAAFNVKRFDNQPSGYARSFAYASGPLYGLLLDDARPKWRTHLQSNTDLAALLSAAYGTRLIRLRDATARDVAKSTYDGDDVFLEEQKQAERMAERMAERIAETRRNFLDTPVLVLPLKSPQYSFNPGDMFTLDEKRLVYGSLKLSDQWGTLTVNKGALLDWGTMTLRVARAATYGEGEIQGPGWTLQLKPGWQVLHESDKDTVHKTE